MNPTIYFVIPSIFVLLGGGAIIKTVFCTGRSMGRKLAGDRSDHIRLSIIGIYGAVGFSMISVALRPDLVVWALALMICATTAFLYSDRRRKWPTKVEKR